jgi:flavin-dependent dehydrogenase
MAMALYSGKLAAQWIDRYLAHQITAQKLRQNYAKQWHRTFSARIRLTHILHSLMVRPALLSSGLRLLNYFPALGDFLVMQTRDLRLVER